jgi:3-oxoacyl-ACP reductase-like protein
MSIFGSIMDKIFHHGGHAPAPARAAARPQSSAPASPTAAATTAPTAQPSAPAAQPSARQPAHTPSQAVDVEAVLQQLADQRGGGGNWRSSIVDLLKLLDLDSSLSARKQLASELNVHTGADGSAEENIALHQAVMTKLEENGGKVPASLKG